MEKLYELVMVIARGRVKDHLIRAATTARSSVMLGPLADFALRSAWYDVLTPSVRSLAQSRVHHALRVVHGHVLTLENVIFHALHLATSYRVRSDAR